jgi:hypothetical protein
MLLEESKIIWLKFASGQMQFPEGRGAQKDMMQI